MDGYVALRADQVQEGDTVWVGGERLACWGVEVLTSEQRVIYLSTSSDVPFELRPERTMFSDDPVWVSEYDAQVTGRVAR